MAALIFNFESRRRWVFNITLWPPYSQEGTSVPIEWDGGRFLEPVWTVARRGKFLPLPGWEILHFSKHPGGHILWGKCIFCFGRPTDILLELQQPLWHKLMELISGTWTLIFPTGMEFVCSDRHLVSVKCHFPSQKDSHSSYKNRNVTLGLIRATILAVGKP